MIGYGYWGPKIVRNLESLCNAKLGMICDRNLIARSRAVVAHPAVPLTGDAAELIGSSAIDAVAVITTVRSHYELAKAALLNGKHVFVEKPFTASSAQAQELIELAASRRLTLMVDHTFLFTGAARTIRRLIDEGSLGKLHGYESTRTNISTHRQDVNVVWDLAPHDLAILSYLLDAEPQAIVATGEGQLEHSANLTAYFPQEFIARIDLRWSSPQKIRKISISAERKTLLWDDLEQIEKVKVYDRAICEAGIDCDAGEYFAPSLEHDEAIQACLQHFVHCVESGATPICNGVAGMKVVKTLEAAQQSMKCGGRLVEL
jgi:predicted dehydrogenase